MKVQYFDIPGLVLIIPGIFRDGRGFFLETFRADTYGDLLGVEFVQDNMSSSRYGTIRGLHFQTLPHSQSKLIRCAHGRICDVAVDLRSGSETFGRHVRVELDGRHQQQFFIPAGFAHGFSVLSQSALVEYKCDAYYEPSSESGILHNDPALAIDWMIPPGAEVVSGKDSRLPGFEELFV